MHLEMTRQPIGADNGQTSLAALLRMVAVATLLLPVLALAQAGAAPKGNPRLASLNIEIWPEYDRPAALVILRGALAEGVKLPAAVTLRLPAASGGPAAVAYSVTADGNLLNLKHERASAGEFITVKFETPERFFHVEFYEPIATNAAARTYRYVWPGDYAVERVTVIVQEPASATEISVEPKLDGVSKGQDGLQYRLADLGALEAGKSLPITLRYTKAGTRPTAENLKPKVSETPAPAMAAPSAPAPPPVAATASSGLPDWVLPLAGFAIVGLLGAVLILWLWRRESRSATPASSATLACAKCGAAQAPGNRFCAKCGAKLA
jgi:hypothetical protein